MARKKVDPNNMSFLDHVEELRWAIIRSIGGVLLMAIVAFIFKDVVIDGVLLGPSKMILSVTRNFVSLLNG